MTNPFIIIHLARGEPVITQIQLQFYVQSIDLVNFVSLLIIT